MAAVSTTLDSFDDSDENDCHKVPLVVPRFKASIVVEFVDKVVVTDKVAGAKREMRGIILGFFSLGQKNDWG